MRSLRCFASFPAVLRESLWDRPTGRTGPTDRPTHPCSAVREGDVPLHYDHACLSVPDPASVPGGRLATAVSEAIRRIETVVESESALVGSRVMVRRRRWRPGPGAVAVALGWATALSRIGGGGNKQSIFTSRDASVVGVTTLGFRGALRGWLFDSTRSVTSSLSLPLPFFKGGGHGSLPHPLVKHYAA